MTNMLRLLAKSRKAWVLLACVAGAVVMNLMGKIDGGQALDFLWKVVTAWMATVAAEDAATKMGAATSDSTTVNQVVSSGAPGGGL